MKHILVTGSQGFLGSRVVDYYKKFYTVTGLTHAELDITDASAVRERVHLIKPELLIHCAAISDTGYAQAHPEESFAINVLASENLACAAAEIGAKLIFMSSDQIYNGNSLHGSTYNPEADINREGLDDNPINVYGRHKLAAEQRILAFCPTAVCLRLSWLFDLPREGMKTNSNLLRNLLLASQSQQVLPFATHEYRGMTYAYDVVQNLEKSFDLSGGVYNFGCSNSLNTYCIACHAVKLLRLDADIVIKDDTRFQAVPRNLTMSLSKLTTSEISFPDTLESIRRCLSTLN